MADSTAPEKRGKKATQSKPPTEPVTEERIVFLPLTELNPFPNHPFKVRDDETMQETAESIKQYGVLVPAIVRPREEGGYEIVAGHRRKHACELAGLKTMPVIVRNLDADVATIIMVDSNLQRENILPSERAQAYKMKLEAIKRQAGRPTKEAKENGAQVGHNFDGKKSVEIIADQAGESKSQVQRYIRLTELAPELQQIQLITDKNNLNEAVCCKRCISSTSNTTRQSAHLWRMVLTDIGRRYAIFVSEILR